ncbi:hypothetical protein HDE_06909 [Halotydeus destructor]|nr:hypothetical protein HDE_06909 [Halotydeus destructor]
MLSAILDSLKLCKRVPILGRFVGLIILISRTISFNPIKSCYAILKTPVRLVRKPVAVVKKPITGTVNVLKDTKDVIVDNPGVDFAQETVSKATGKVVDAGQQLTTKMADIAGKTAIPDSLVELTTEDLTSLASSQWSTVENKMADSMDTIGSAAGSIKEMVPAEKVTRKSKKLKSLFKKKPPTPTP